MKTRNELENMTMEAILGYFRNKHCLEYKYKFENMDREEVITEYYFSNFCRFNLRYDFENWTNDRIIAFRLGLIKIDFYDKFGNMTKEELIEYYYRPLSLTAGAA